MNYKNRRLSEHQLLREWSSELSAISDRQPTISRSLYDNYKTIYQKLSCQPRRIRRQLQGHGKLALSRVAMLLALGGALPASAATLSVNALIPDVDATDGKCSLIEAIENANADAAVHTDCLKGNGADTINLQPNATYTLTKIDNERKLSYRERYANGLPIISSALTIEGNHSVIERFDNDDIGFNLIEVSSSGDLTLNNLSLQGGGGYYGYRGYYSFDFDNIGTSTALFNNSGLVKLNDVEISNNRGPFHTVDNRGALSITNSSIRRNNSGSIYNDGSLIVKNSIMDRNQSGHIWNPGSAMIINSTFSGSNIVDSSAIRNDGDMQLLHCTISGNAAPFNSSGGNVIFNSGNLILKGNLISGNKLKFTNRGVITSNNNILGESGKYFASFVVGFTPDATDIVATIDGNRPSTVEEIFGTTPELKDNGGLTETFALSAGGLAVDAANANDCPSHDQRGLVRPQGAGCDIGAYEMPVSTLGDYVWRDTNGDGIQGTNEPGLANVIVHLQTCSGSTLETITTDTKGKFTFTGMSPGKYQMQFNLPANYVFSPEKAGSDTRLDSNVDQATGITACYNMPQGKYRRAVDAGMVPTTSATGVGLLGDYIWKDDNGNGIQDSNESGLANVAIDLQTCDGSYLASTISDSSGTYHFDKLGAGHYRMQFHLPAAYQFSAEKVNDQYKLDSNANVTTGLTGCYDMTQGWKRRAIDVGMVADTIGGPADTVTLVNAIYFSADKKLWIRAQSDGPAGTTEITATMTVNGNELPVGAIGWKASKNFYQQVFLNVTEAPSSITLTSDQGGKASGRVQLR